MKKNKKVDLQSLLYNKNFLIGFSIVMALIIWIAVTLNESPEVERTIKNVKVEIETGVPNQLGYKIFGEKNFYVDVTVKGKRYLVGDNVLSKDDIKVTAITRYVDSVGKSQLQLKATPKDPNAGFNVISKSLDYIDVYFDVPKRIEMSITPNIVISDKLLYSDEYIAQKELLSTNKVIIDGPATEINKIKNVFARINVKEPLKKTQSFPAEILITDEYGKSIKYIDVNPDLNSVSITIPVYKKAKLPISVDFINAPSDSIKKLLDITIKPKALNIAAPEDTLENKESISIGKIDFNKLKEGKNNFLFKTADIPNIVVIDDIDEISVSINASEMKSTKSKIKSENISVTNVPVGYTVTVQKAPIKDVTIIGPQSEIDNITTDDIIANVNLDKDNFKEGKQNLIAQVTVKNNKCWVYGTYNVLIDVKAE